MAGGKILILSDHPRLARAIEQVYPPILACPLLCYSESVKY